APQAGGGCAAAPGGGACAGSGCTRCCRSRPPGCPPGVGGRGGLIQARPVRNGEHGRRAGRPGGPRRRDGPGSALGPGAPCVSTTRRFVPPISTTRGRYRGNGTACRPGWRSDVWRMGRSARGQGPAPPGIGTVAGVGGQEYRGGTTRSAKEPAMTNLEARYDHVIIGGGVAADSAATAIREASPDATIAILSADPHEPVYRPALSKDLWTGESADPDSQDLRTAEETGASLFTSTLVTELLPNSHGVLTARGNHLRYGKALLATGSSARHFP